MKQKDGVFRQRVGYLIEQDICKKFSLYYNKRQRTQGYFDAYNDNTIFEIKASSINNPYLQISTCKGFEHRLKHRQSRLI